MGQDSLAAELPFASSAVPAGARVLTRSVLTRPGKRSPSGSCLQWPGAENRGRGRLAGKLVGLGSQGPAACVCRAGDRAWPPTLRAVVGGAAGARWTRGEFGSSSRHAARPRCGSRRPVGAFTFLQGRLQKAGAAAVKSLPCLSRLRPCCGSQFEKRRLPAFPGSKGTW